MKRSTRAMIAACSLMALMATEAHAQQRSGIPQMVYAAAIGAYAVTMNVLPGETACLACIFPKPPGGTVETCDTAGMETR